MTGDLKVAHFLNKGCTAGGDGGWKPSVPVRPRAADAWAPGRPGAERPGHASHTDARTGVARRYVYNCVPIKSSLNMATPWVRHTPCGHLMHRPVRTADGREGVQRISTICSAYHFE